MEESFKEGSKDYKGKRSVQNKLSEIRGNNIVTTVIYIIYSEKIVNIRKLWVLWCGKQRPRGRKTKSSNKSVNNRTSGKQISVTNIINKNNKSVIGKLGKFKVKIEIERRKISLGSIVEKILSQRNLNIPTCIGVYRLILPIRGFRENIPPNRSLQAYPAYLEFRNIKTRLNRGYQA